MLGTRPSASVDMFRLDLNEKVAREIRRLVRHTLEEGETALLGSQASLAERTHEARKCIKRARAVLALLERSEIRSGIADACRRAAAQLAGPRGHAALLHSYERLTSLDPACEHDELRRALQSRARAVADAPEFLHSAARCLHQGRHLAKSLEVRGEGFSAIARGFRLTHRDARRALRVARATGKPAHFHAFRKPCKRHFYQVRLLDDVWPVVVEARASELDRLTELAGDHHDLSLLRVEATHLIGRAAARDVARRIRRRERDLEAQIIALGELCFAERSRAITSRLARYWAATVRNGIVAKPSPER